MFHENPVGYGEGRHQGNRGVGALDDAIGPGSAPFDRLVSLVGSGALVPSFCGTSCKPDLLAQAQIGEDFGILFLNGEQVVAGAAIVGDGLAVGAGVGAIVTAEAAGKVVMSRPKLFGCTPQATFISGKTILSVGVQAYQPRNKHGQKELAPDAFHDGESTRYVRMRRDVAVAKGCEGYEAEVEGAGLGELLGCGERTGAHLFENPIEEPKVNAREQVCAERSV